MVRGARVGALLLLLLALVACRSSEEEPRQVETVDVPPLLTVDIEQDVQEPERVPELVGVLPGNFPGDLPLYRPSSLVDFGTTEDGHYVSLLSQHGRARIAGDLEASLRRAGWTVEPGPSGSRSLRKDGRRVKLLVEDSAPGATYRYDY